MMKAKVKRILKSKLVKNSMWLFILKIMSTVIPMLTIPYITRVLGPSEYGVFSIALNWILYFQVIVEYGFALTGARKIALDSSKENMQKLFNNIISSRLILFIISFLIMNILALLCHFGIEMYMCMILLFTMVFGTALQLTWLFQGLQDMKFITIADSISRVISVILIFLIIKNSSDIYLYCILYSITTLLSSIISLILVKKKYNLKFKFSKFVNIKNELIEGKELFASACATKIFSGIGLTILGFVSTKSIAGIYSAISKIPLVLTYMFAPISQALYPYSSEQYQKSFESATNRIKKIAVPMTFLFFGISIIIVLFRNLIILKLFGNEYLNYSFILIPLVIQFVFAVINNFLGIQILVASGNQKSYSRAFIIDSLLMFLLNIVLGYKYTIYGVALANPIGEIILSILLYYEIYTIKRSVKND